MQRIPTHTLTHKEKWMYTKYENGAGGKRGFINGTVININYLLWLNLSRFGSAVNDRFCVCLFHASASEVFFLCLSNCHFHIAAYRAHTTTQFYFMLFLALLLINWAISLADAFARHVRCGRNGVQHSSLRNGVCSATARYLFDLGPQQNSRRITDMIR